jgi:glycosyltransferase involved in cell wall biosynthesis
MRTILVLSQNSVFDLGKGAGKEVIYKTLIGLSQKFNVVLIAPGDDPNINNCKFIQLPSKTFNTINTIKFWGYLFNFLHVLRLNYRIKIIIKRHKINPDVVYLAGPFMSYIGHFMYEGKKPIIVRYFGVNWRPEKHHTLRQRLKFYLKNKGYKKFGDYVIMTNDGTRGDEFLLQLGCPKEKLWFIPNGLDFINEKGDKQENRDTILRKYRIDTHNLILLSVSRLAAWKRVDKAILALKELVKTEPKVSLIIVGDGEERLRLENLAKFNDLDDHIIFAGAVEHAELTKFYHACDVFLSFYDYSNAGNPLFEAMMHQCCIVTVDSPAMKYFVSNKAAIMLQNTEPKVISEALLSVVKNQSERMEYGTNAAREIRENMWSWEVRIKNEVDKIVEIAAGPKYRENV